MNAMDARAAHDVYRAQTVPDGVRLKLDTNELPGADPAWFESLNADAAAFYPSGNQLEHLIAVRHKTPVDRVLVTAGGDEAIERMIRVTAGPDAPVVAAAPTFEMIPRYAAMAGASFIGVPWQDDADYPAEDVLNLSTQKRAGLLAVVTPNNPTGAAVSRKVVTSLIERSRCPVLLDLAYAEFAADDLTDLALTTPGVVAIRTFSKAWGLAGLRVGYAIGDPELIAAMRSAGGPYSVSTIARAVAANAMGSDPSWLAARVGGIADARSRVLALCENRGVTALRSEANFVLLRTPEPEAAWQRLINRGILVRRWLDRAGLEDALRVSLPYDSKQTEKLLAALDAALSPRETA